MAAALEIGDRFELARALSGAARAVAFAAEVGLRSARNALPRRGLAALRRPPVRRPLDSGVVEHLGRGRAGPRRRGRPRPGAGAAGRGDRGPHRAAGRRGHAAPPRRHRARAARAVAAGGARRAAVAAGHRAPARRRRRVARPHRPVGAAVPRVGRGARPAAARPRARLDRRPAPRRGLRAGRAADHPGRRARTCCWSAPCCTTSARAAAATTPWWGSRSPRRSGAGWGSPSPTSRCSARWSRHHLLLPHTATRRDLDDPATIIRVVETLAATAGARRSGGRSLLDLLEALAEADSLATGPGVWSPWKQVADRRAGARAAAPLLAGERARPRPVRARRRRSVVAAVAAEGRPQVRFETGATRPR